MTWPCTEWWEEGEERQVEKVTEEGKTMVYIGEWDQLGEHKAREI